MFDRVLTDSKAIAAEVERRRQGKPVDGEFKFQLRLSVPDRADLARHLRDSAAMARGGYSQGGVIPETETMLRVLEAVAAATAAEGAQSVKVALRTPQCATIRRVLKASQVRAGDAVWADVIGRLVALWEKFYGHSEAAEAEAAGRPPRFAADEGGWRTL